MANIKKNPKDISKKRCVSLSDNEIKEIEKLTKQKSLTLSIRWLFDKVKVVTFSKRIVEKYL